VGRSSDFATVSTQRRVLLSRPLLIQTTLVISLPYSLELSNLFILILQALAPLFSDVSQSRPLIPLNLLLHVVLLHLITQCLIILSLAVSLVLSLHVQ